MLGVFREYRTALLTVSLLIALYKCIELMIPVLAARVINALEAHRPTSEIWVMAVTAFVVWVVHGNLLAYLVDRIEVKCFSFPAGVNAMDPPLSVVALMSQNGCDTLGNHSLIGGRFHGTGSRPRN